MTVISLSISVSTRRSYLRVSAEFLDVVDGPEQALLVIPLWSDIEPKGGGTAIACDGIKWIAKHLVIVSSFLNASF
jgi:hypothetical protein